MINLCNSVNRIRAKDKNLFMTTKLLKAVRNLYSTGERTWECRALQGFFVIDHLGRVSGCHIHDPVASIFDLPQAWNSARFNGLRRTYKKCMECSYLCYMFYSLHGGVLGNLQIAQEKWRGSKLLLRRKGFKPPDLAKQI
jgi:MoaA/NifB/PqqE/SkfB family radical SAM enzyme